MSSFRSVVNRPDVIYSLKPKIPFINEYPTIEATSLLTIHFRLLDSCTCRLSVRPRNRTKGHSLFSLRLFRFFFLLATPLHPNAAAIIELRLCLSVGRCIDLIASEEHGGSPLPQSLQLPLFSRRSVRVHAGSCCSLCVLRQPIVSRTRG